MQIIKNVDKDMEETLFGCNCIYPNYDFENKMLYIFTRTSSMIIRNISISASLLCRESFFKRFINIIKKDIKVDIDFCFDEIEKDLFKYVLDKKYGEILFKKNNEHENGYSTYYCETTFPITCMFDFFDKLRYLFTGNIFNATIEFNNDIMNINEESFTKTEYMHGYRIF